MDKSKKQFWIVIGVFAAGGVGYLLYDKYVKQNSTVQTIGWLQSIKNYF
jgi:hypothetical protein